MKRSLLAICAVFCCNALFAVNPYLPLWEFIPDGEPYVFEDPDHPGEYRVYVYGSHDNLITEYCGRDQVVWSASVNDLNNWRYDGVIFESKKTVDGRDLNEGGVGDVLYAPDVACVTNPDGTKTYYLYPNVQNGGRQELIAKSNRPDGPFEVCNWDPKDPFKVTGILRFDPGVLVDDDGRVYGYWGFEQSYAAELDPATMCTVKKGTKVIEDMVSARFQEGDFRFFEASSIRKIKDKYVFIYSRWTEDGEFGLPDTNYTLAYAWSNQPLGPWTYGGTIIDGRGKEQQADGSYVITATPTGNTHGSICEINGKWWVFYHRQAGVNEYSRQAMVAPIEVEVVEGAEGYVKISEGEFNSEGFEVDGLNPLESHAAGIACYFVGPEPAHQEYPNVIYPGSHTEVLRIDYDGTTPVYDPSINRCNMVNNVAGSVVGYKYFNFSHTQALSNIALELTHTPCGVQGEVEVWLDRPTAAEGGKLLGALSLSGNASQESLVSLIQMQGLSDATGKHALFFVFKSEVQGQSLTTLHAFRFVESQPRSFHWAYLILALVLATGVCLLFRKKKA